MLAAAPISTKLLPNQGSRRLREALRYVERGWIPISPETEILIKDILDKPTLSFRSLLREISKDFGLLTFVLNMAGRESLSKSSNPIDLLESLGEVKIREILSAKSNQISHHDFKAPKENTLHRIRHSIIACGTTMALAEKAGIDQEIASTWATIRQFGNLAVGWNYPNSVAKARNGSESSRANYEDRLVDTLGFDPVTLGILLTAQWAQDADSLLEGWNGVKDKIDGELQGLIDLGEILAQTQDQSNYPVNDAIVEDALSKIEHYMGPGGYDKIREKIAERYPHYSKLSPDMIPANLSPEDASAKHQALYQRKRLESNGYVKHCEPDVQKRFEDIYRQLSPNSVSVSALSSLVNGFLPTVGFQNGCVYLLDRNKMMLVPQLKFGELSDRKPKSVSCSCGGSFRAHPASEAFHSTIPLTERGVVVNGSEVSHISGRFGTGDKLGVLYLEFQEHENQTFDDGQRLMLFKAIRVCLTDCLKLM